MSLDTLIEKIIEKQNPTVAGLDPKLEYIPRFLKEESYAKFGKTLEGAADAVLRFNCALIDELAPIVPAIKPQCAYYEALGWPGMRALAETMEYARKKGLFVITDGKRNDIGTTMEAYANAHLGKTDVDGELLTPFAGDALTVNAYLGSDGVKPLLGLCKREDKGIFVLVKTSNPSSGELQDQQLKNGKSVYYQMGAMCEQWGELLPGAYVYSGVGAVVGATYPEQLRELRIEFPHTFFLVPGYGAQGGGADDVAPAFDASGLGAVINASRSILCAWQKENAPEQEFAEAAAREAVRMRDAITARIGRIG